MQPRLLALHDTALDAVLSASVEARQLRPQASAPGGSLLSVGDNGEATINIRGPVMYEPSWVHALFGLDCCTWSGGVKAMAAAEADPRVKRVKFAAHTPGGSVDGMAEAIAARLAMAKPSYTEVSELCSSAGYIFAASRGEIFATNEIATIGSVGVVASYAKPSSDVVQITSSQAPDKRPDPGSPEGKAVLQAHLDQVHAYAADVIARGRGTTAETVNRDYGRGASMTAGAALRSGMIDGIRPSGTSSPARRGGPLRKGQSMDQATLRAEHPELVKAIEASAYERGQQEERQRARSHAELAEASGAHHLALQAILAGEPVSAAAMKAHVLAGISAAAPTPAPAAPPAAPAGIREARLQPPPVVSAEASLPGGENGLHAAVLALLEGPQL